METVVDICKTVLRKLATTGNEKKGFVSSGQLIFPSKNSIKRISEQELRQLFIDEFKEKYSSLYYSIETPTVKKYSFTNNESVIKIADLDNAGQSALIDLSVFEKEKDFYKRRVNIEFKHRNATYNSISKDLLKLMHEEENGAFVFLLKNTNTGTLTNLAANRFGVIDKLITSLKRHHNLLSWNGSDHKCIELVLLSLQENNKKTGLPFITYRKIFKSELETLDNSLDKWVREDLDDIIYQKNNKKKII